MRRLDITHMDGGEWISAYFMGGEYVTSGWGWICSQIGREFECDYEDIDCDEPDERDECGDDLVTVNGRAVARLTWTVS